MKALVYTGPSTVEFRNEPPPRIASEEALVKIDAAGICGSDLHAFLGHDSRRVPPLILGHEVSGTVVEGPNPGSKIVINPLITCGTCDNCLDGRTNLCENRQLIGMNRPGAFADLISIPTTNLIDIPDNSSSVDLAMSEPAAVSLHAVRLVDRVLTRPISEGSALVIGGGVVGLFCVYFLRDYGCTDITLAETNPLRRKTAEDTQTCKVIDSKKHIIKSKQYDAVFDAVGIEVTRATSIDAVKNGGVVLHLGLGSATGGMDARSMTLSEITFIGAYTYTAYDFVVAARKIANGTIQPLNWVDERPMADGASAFKELIDGRVSSPKIILRP